MALGRAGAMESDGRAAPGPDRPRHARVRPDAGGGAGGGGGRGRRRCLAGGRAAHAGCVDPRPPPRPRPRRGRLRVPQPLAAQRGQVLRRGWTQAGGRRRGGNRGPVRRGRLGAGGAPGTGARARRSARRLPAGAALGLPAGPLRAPRPARLRERGDLPGRAVGLRAAGSRRWRRSAWSPTGATSTKAAAPSTRSCWPRASAEAARRSALPSTATATGWSPWTPREVIRDGDELLALCARHLAEVGALHGGVAVTVMSNYGFHRAMSEAGIEVATTPVGDRHVIAELEGRGWALGGEQSGHIIWSEYGPTGDGIAAALLVMRALGDAELAAAIPMQKLPQVLENVEIADRGALEQASAVWEAVERESDALEGRGRVLVRASGTEPLVRVMVEAPTQEECEEVCARLVDRDHERRAGSRWMRRVRPACAPGTLYSYRLPMCGIVGYVGKRPCRDLLMAGLEKLEYRGYDSAGHLAARRRADRLGAGGGQPGQPARRDRPQRRRGGRRGGAAAGDDRARPHSLGDPRPGERGERPPARRLRGAGPDRPQRDRREPHRAAPRARGRRASVQLRDRCRDRRPPDRAPRPGRPDRGGASGVRRAARPLRVRGHARRPSRHACRRAAGVPAGRRAGRRGDLRRLGDSRPSSPRPGACS